MYELEAVGSDMTVSRPKSDRRAWPVLSIRMLALESKLGKMEGRIQLWKEDAPL